MYVQACVKDEECVDGMMGNRQGRRKKVDFFF